ncbi:transposase [Herbaspirillum seropedicae]|uniref:hypothetical protein n=1 Tax=Herbaspirillum seropedicae TaxID=964 RepID=UPI000863ABD0|nr:hypothetical protein [Herbaspirillum seropedicae]AON56941.1 hypothetical protein Hsc_4686 [Herbaspirillum seropedicae]UMU23822.1 transposase [Herbaspirillum seropedicae]
MNLSFNGKFRNEFLALECSRNQLEANVVIEDSDRRDRPRNPAEPPNLAQPAEGILGGQVASVMLLKKCVGEEWQGCPLEREAIS